MAKNQSKDVWGVRVEDSNYDGQNEYFLLRGNTAGEVEPRAIKLYARRHRVTKSEPPLAPFVRRIELIGTLND